MRIGFDITAIDSQPSGVGHYTLHLLNHLIEHCQGHEYVLLSHRRANPGGLALHAGATIHTDPFPSRMLWMQSRLPHQVREQRLDLCHYPNSIAPLLSPCPYVATIHDMSLSLMPQYHPWRRQMMIRPLIPLVARRARRVITVSQHARDDIVRVLRLPPEHVTVIPEAAAPYFQPTSIAEQQRVRAKYRLSQPYLLYVGTLEPRKNLSRLISAWHHLYSSGTISHQLVLAGARGWLDGPILQQIQRLIHRDAIKVLGYVAAHDLPALYGAADAFAFPSLYEGFGLPVIEAMACGTPVLISTTAALVEVAGDAALQTDPYSVAAIKAGLEQILTDASLRGRLRTRGLRRAEQFSWRDAALKTAQVYQSVLESEPVTASSPVDSVSVARTGR